MRNEDVNLRGIAIFFGALALVLVAAYLALGGMVKRFESDARNRDEGEARGRGSASTIVSRTYFPYPREQPHPRVDLETFRVHEEAELNSYGWINQTAGIVRIPIDRAIDLLVERQGGTK